MDEHDFPEHRKLHAVKTDKLAVTRFIEWFHEQGWSLFRAPTDAEREAWAAEWKATYHRLMARRSPDVDAVLDVLLMKDAGPALIRDSRRIEQLLGEFFEIDPDKLEAEKLAMLEGLRRLHERG